MICPTCVFISLLDLKSKQGKKKVMWHPIYWYVKWYVKSYAGQSQIWRQTESFTLVIAKLIIQTIKDSQYYFWAGNEWNIHCNRRQTSWLALWPHSCLSQIQMLRWRKDLSWLAKTMLELQRCHLLELHITKLNNVLVVTSESVTM